MQQDRGWWHPTCTNMDSKEWWEGGCYNIPFHFVCTIPFHFVCSMNCAIVYNFYIMHYQDYI